LWVKCRLKLIGRQCGRSRRMRLTFNSRSSNVLHGTFCMPPKKRFALRADTMRRSGPLRWIEDAEANRFCLLALSERSQSLPRAVLRPFETAEGRSRLSDGASVRLIEARAPSTDGGNQVGARRLFFRLISPFRVPRDIE